MKLVTAEPKQNVIDYAESLYERAKTGEIQSIACALILSRNRTASGWSGIGWHAVNLMGELVVLQRDLTDSVMDLRVDPETGDRED